MSAVPRVSLPHAICKRKMSISLSDCWRDITRKYRKCYAIAKSHQPDHPPGYVSSFLDGKIKVYAKSWASVIQDARWRYYFYKDKLQSDTFENTESEEHDSGLSYLQRKYPTLLPPEEMQNE